jgi:Zn-dependent protease with chaperone function
MAFEAAKHRHPNEQSYFIIAAVTGGLLWLSLLVVTFGILLGVGLLLLGVFWALGKMFRAQILGNAVRVSPKQYPSLFALNQQVSETLGLQNPPEIYVLSGSGLINAFALRFFGRGSRYVLLLSELIDLTLERGKPEELHAILAHELAHHALGHTSPWKQFLMMPANFIAFLPNAYSRACEYSCDRVALVIAQDKSAVKRALLTITVGSKMLADHTDEAEFLTQEQELGGFFAFLAEILSTHPRMPRRILALNTYEKQLE